MLLSFRVANFRSIRDEQELSLRVPTSVRNSEEMVQAEAAGWDPGVSTVAGIFGANASGKSNFLDALRAMCLLVIGGGPGAGRHLGIEGRTPFAPEPFSFDYEKSGEPSEFDIEMWIDRVRHHYGFRATEDRIIHEWLYAWPHGRRQTWLERDGSSGRDEYYFGKAFVGPNRTIEKLTRPERLFLTTAADYNHPRAMKVWSWFTGNLVLVEPRPVESPLVRQAQDQHGVPSSGPLPDRLVDLLRLADLGISGARLVRRTQDPSGAVARHAQPETEYEVQFIHTTGSNESYVLNWWEESRGTRVWFLLSQWILTVLDSGTVMLVDELDTSLHSHLAAEIVRVFRDPSLNPHQAQLIFNAHDTNLIGNLLGETPLRRDQVWFTEKDEEGATHLYALSDFKPRKQWNLERAYLQGRYGAVPVVDLPGLNLVVGERNG